MNTRILIPLLLAGAVALACGSRSHADATAKPTDKSVRQSGNALAMTAAPLAAAAPEKHAGTRRGCRAAEAARSSCAPKRARSTSRSISPTRAKKNVELEFPSGQEYDFAVIDSTGREVYRWGKERMFTQSLQNRLLDGGETMRYEETRRQGAAQRQLRRRRHAAQQQLPRAGAGELRLQ